MNLRLLEKNLAYYKEQEDISIEHLLGIFLDLCTDIGNALQIPAERCPCKKETELISNLVWLGNMFLRIRKYHDASISSARSMLARSLVETDPKLREEVTALSESLNRLQNQETEVNRLRKKKKDLEDQIQSITSRLEKTGTTQEEIWELEQQEDELGRHLSTLENYDFGKQQQLIDVLIERIGPLKSKKEQLENQLADMTTEEQSYNTSIKELESAISEKEQAVVELKNTVDNLSSESARLDIESDNLNLQLPKITEENNLAKERHQQISEQHQKLLNDTGALNQLVAQINIEISKLNSKKAILETHIKTLPIDRDNLSSNVQDLTKKQGLILDEISELEKSRDRLQEELPILTSQRTVAETQKTELFQIHTKTIEDTQSLQRKADEISRIIQTDLLPKLQDAEKAKKDAENKRDSISSSIDTLDSDVAELNQQISAMEQALKDRNEENLKSSLEETKRKLQDRIDNCNTLKERIDQLQNDLQTLEPVFLNTKETAQNLQSERTMINEEIRKYNALLLELQKDELNYSKRRQQHEMLKNIVLQLEDDCNVFLDRTGLENISSNSELQNNLRKVDDYLSSIYNTVKSYTELMENRL